MCFYYTKSTLSTNTNIKLAPRSHPSDRPPRRGTTEGTRKTAHTVRIIFLNFLKTLRAVLIFFVKKPRSSLTVRKQYERHVGRKKRFRRKDRQRNRIHRAAARRTAWPIRRGNDTGRTPSGAPKSMVFTNQSPPAVRGARTPRIGGAPRPVKTMVFIKISKIDFVGDL